MKKYVLILLGLVCLPVYALLPRITGIEGDVLKNVNARLLALSKDPALPDYDLKEQINQAMLPFGFFKAHIIIEENTKDTMQINIKPGPQLPIKKLSVSLIGEGKDNPEINARVRDIPIKRGDPLLIKNYNSSKQNILNAAENQGFLRGNFKKAAIQIDRIQYTANITLIFDTGPLYHFGQVQFNPTNISPALLHKYIPFHSGQPYSTKTILAFNQQLSNSGYFSTVAIRPDIGQSTDIPITVITEPTAKFTYDYSLGYGTDTGVRGRAGMHIIPFNKQGHTLNTLAQGSLTQNILQAQYMIPGAIPSIDNYAITGSLSTLKYNSGYSNNLLFSAGQNHKLTDFQRSLSLNTLFERFHYTNQKDVYKNIFFPKAIFSFDHTTSPLFSPSGYSLTLTAFGANTAVLSDLSFTQASIDAKAAYRFDPLRTRFYVHTIAGLTQTNDISKLPLSLALMLGGAQDLKAYSINSVGPGKIVQYAGLEIQKETLSSWYLTGSVDTGAVYNPTPKNQLYDVGAGLMWVSPIGPIKIGVAQAVNNHFERLKDMGPRLVINMGADL